MPTFELREADNDLHGRLALVTGASGGIGAACCRALARAGCDVALHYSANATAAESLARELSSLHPDRTFTTHRADFSSTPSASSLVTAVLAHPSHSPAHSSVSVLVANAGLGRRIRDPSLVADEDWDAMMQVNAKAPFVVTRAAVEGMRRQGWGRVVVVGSIASKGGGMNGCHYAAAKGAVSSMALNLSTVLAPENVTINVVSPAMIGSTGMVPAAKSRTLETAAGGGGGDPSASAKAMASDLAESDPGLAIASTIPLGRLGEPDEVANAVMMFVKTGYVTGQDLVLGGGLK